MSRYIITAIRISLIGAVAFGLFFAVVVIPTTASDQVEQFPPYRPYAVPYATAADLALLSVLGALLATLMLLSMVTRDAIFTARAFLWVNAVIGCIAFATVVTAAVAAHLFFFGIPDPPDNDMQSLGLFLGTGACAALGVTFVLLMLVMRQLLRQAVELRTEMAEVV